MRKCFAVFVLCFAFSTISFAQEVRGSVVDANTSEALVGVSVVVKGTSTGVMTDLDGSFKISVPADAQQTLVISYVGYETQEVAAQQVSVVNLKPDAVILNDVVVSSQIAIQRKTPVAVSNVTFDVIDVKLGSQEFPEILKSTPGVYATKRGGGFGDSELRMRGFKSENVAVLVNGIPMNDMEWGGLYWSNWAGLSDVTRVMQTQRGLGASKVSAPSVGGTINIVTKGIEAKKGGTVSYEIGNDGYNKMLFSISSGLLKNGWAFTVLGARTYGNGYIQGTEFEGYNYFVNISKILGENHTLSLTAFGAPQKHYQRNNNDNDFLTIKEWQRVGNYMNGDSPYKYNTSYGFGKNGERKTSSYNEYHKPQISLNWNWTIDHKSNLSTVLYTSIGRGNGYGGQGTGEYSHTSWYGASNGLVNNTFRNPDGTFAYDKMEDINIASTRGSLLVMSENPNYHNWYGLISTYSNSFTQNIDFYGGVDFRYYKGTHTNKIIDLYSGNYFIDGTRGSVKVENNAAAADPAWVNQKLQIGDVVYRDYDGFVLQEGLFAQVEGTFLDKMLTTFVSGSLSNTTYWRYDRFYYDAEHAKSKTVNFTGFTLKGGANYNFADYHNVFANIGYISRAPYFSGGAFLQSTTSNELNPSGVNEKIFSAEIGYGFRWKNILAVVNGYYTKWIDKTMTKYTEIGQSGDRAIINMQGVNARHIGIELEVKAKPARWLELTGMLSLGDWQWDSNSTGYWYSIQGQPLADITTGAVASDIGAGDHASSTINTKGIKVGGAAQTTYDIGVIVKPVRDLRIGANLNGFSRMFADYSFSGTNLNANSVYNVKPTWQVPGAAIVEMYTSYDFKLSGLDATVSGTCQNLFNQIYIADAADGGTGTWETARVMYGFGRTWTARLKIKF